MLSFLIKYSKKINRIFIGLFCIMIWQGCFKFRTSDHDVLKAFEAKNISVEIKDYEYSKNKKLHYIESGNMDAPTIYFIHGTPGASNNFQNFLLDSQLCAQYHMISVDRPGFGYSNFGKAENVGEQVEIFNAFIRKNTKGEPIILVGHSLGGPIIMAMAAKDTSLFNTLIMLAGSVSPELEPAEKWRKPLASIFFRWMAPGAMRPSNDEMVDFKTYIKQMPLLLQQVRCTTYLIHGTKDMLVPYGNLAYAEKYLIHDASTNVVTIENENHFFPWTKFEDIRALLLYIRKEKIAWK